MCAFAPRSRFFTVVGLLERLMPDRARVGGDGPVHEEALRLRNDPSLAFPSGDIRRVQPTRIPELPGEPLTPYRDGIEVTTTFLGLTGSVSPMPTYMAEEVAQDDDTAQRDFLDVFHHRVLSLLYRVVTRYSGAREHLSSADDVWTHRYLTTAGLDAVAAGPSDVLPRWLILRLLPLLVGHNRSAASLELALQEAMRAVLGETGRLEVRQFVGSRAPVDAQQRTQLGVRNHALGQTVMIGARSVDRAGRFAIRVGPLTTRNYSGFMKDGPHARTIRAVVELFTRQPLDYDLELLLEEDAVPRFRLSAEYPVPLGRGTWLRAKPTAQVHVIKDASRAERPAAA